MVIGNIQISKDVIIKLQKIIFNKDLKDIFSFLKKNKFFVHL